MEGKLDTIMITRTTTTTTTTAAAAVAARASTQSFVEINTKA